MLTEGKVVIVTGGAQGMGRAFAEQFLKNGAKVCICDINDTEGEATLAELHSKYGTDNSIFVKCNVINQKDFEGTFRATIDKFGPIDIVVNNAGVGGEGPDQWERTIDINMKGTLRGTRLAVHHMCKANGGHGGLVINVGSSGGLRPNAFAPVYGCSKAGLIMMTRSYAMMPNMQAEGIRFNTLCPSFVDTPMLQNIKNANVENNAQVAAFVESIGVISAEEAALALMDIVADDTKNGATLLVGKREGRKYCTFNLELV